MLLALVLIAAALTATAAQARAAVVTGGHIELALRVHWLAYLADEGIGFDRIGPRHGDRYPLHGGHIDLDRPLDGFVRGRGAWLLSRQDYGEEYVSAVKFENPSIRIKKNQTARLFMRVNGTRLRVATVRGFHRRAADHVFTLEEGHARFSGAIAEVFEETFGIAYPRRGVPLAGVDIKAQLGDPVPR